MNESPHHARQRTLSSRSGCNPRLPRAGSLSLAARGLCLVIPTLPNQVNVFLSLQNLADSMIADRVVRSGYILLFGPLKPLEESLRGVGRLAWLICEGDKNEGINLLTAGKRFR